VFLSEAVFFPERVVAQRAAECAVVGDKSLLLRARYLCRQQEHAVRTTLEGVF